MDSQAAEQAIQGSYSGRKAKCAADRAKAILPGPSASEAGQGQPIMSDRKRGRGEGAGNHSVGRIGSLRWELKC